MSLSVPENARLEIKFVSYASKFDDINELDTSASIRILFPFP